MVEREIPLEGGRERVDTSRNDYDVDLSEIFLRVERRLHENQNTRAMVHAGLGQLRAMIKKNRVADNSFIELCSGGCKEAQLVWILATCSDEPTPERVDQLLGVNDRQLKALVKSLRKEAGRVDKINDQKVRVLLKDAGLTHPFLLPSRMRDYAELLELLARLRWTVYWTAAKVRLVAYVRERTNQFHDAEVAEILATLLNRQDYTEKAHAAWRRRHFPSGAQLFRKLSSQPSEDFVGTFKAIFESVFYGSEYALFLKLAQRNLR